MTFSKIAYRIGILACIVLIISCFLPWTYYADVHIPTEAQKTFTGFVTYNNNYGKPGKLLTGIALLSLIFMLVPKIWAKRTNFFIAALGVGYSIKTYILFTSCYNAYCPEKKAGIFIMMAAMIIILIAGAFPDIELKKKEIN